MVFEYQAPASVFALRPSGAAVGVDGVLVTVSGAAFPSARVLCRFAGVQGDPHVGNAVAHLSESAVVCAAPGALAPGVMSLDLSVNGGTDWTAPSVPFLLFHAPVCPQPSTLHPLPSTLHPKP